jgi:hypothetical protein
MVKLLRRISHILLTKLIVNIFLQNYGGLPDRSFFIFVDIFMKTLVLRAFQSRRHNLNLSKLGKVI